jgi:cytosine/adenosine deaminase-related metal-dependent hydrolase
MTTANAMLLRNVRPLAGETADVLISNGIIRQVAPGLAAPEGTIPAEDGQGGILLPGLVDAHTHLDKTFWELPWRPHQAGPRIIDKIENERRLRRELGLSPEAQAGRQIRQAVAMGTTHIRSHVDIDTEVGLTSLEGVARARESHRDRITLQLVAFPQSGLLIRPGTTELMEAALRSGAADLVGGIDPSSIDRDPAGHLDAVFGLAERFSAGVDIHLHEPGALGAFSIELIAERTRALSMAGRVTISHAFCLGMVEESHLAQLLDLLRECGIAIMTHAPGHSAFPPVKRLSEAGIRICSGSDGIRDSWGPYGNADMLERAMLIGYRSNFRRDDELELALEIATKGGAAVMAAADYGLAPGCRADLVVVPGETLAEAVVSRRPRALVIKAGRIVARDGTYSE